MKMPFAIAKFGIAYLLRKESGQDEMTTLIFDVTCGWSVVAKPGKESIEICYAWGADGSGFFNSATGIAR